MKKITLIAAICTLVAVGANAGYKEINTSSNNNRGGFMGNGTIVTVEQVKEMRDDSPVILKGNIVQRMGDDKYLFQDDTGSIKVEIDEEDWRGQTVDITDTVKIYGELDKGWFGYEIDTDYIEVM